MSTQPDLSSKIIKLFSKIFYFQYGNILMSFRDFMITHKKEYADQAEFRNRFSIFRQNMQRIKQLQRTERGTATYGITKFSDLSGTVLEFSQAGRLKLYNIIILLCSVTVSSVVLNELSCCPHFI